MRKVYRDGLPYIYEEDHLAALEAAVKEKDEQIAALSNEILRRPVYELQIRELKEQIATLEGFLAEGIRYTEECNKLLRLQSLRKWILEAQDSLKGKEA